MSLNSLSFVIFLPLTVLIYFWIPQKHRYIWLFAASCFFYLSNDIHFLAGLAFCTVTTYITGLLLEKGTDSRRKTVLIFCIAANILMLFLFRYTALLSKWAPAGILFYSLQAIGYIGDIYTHKIKAERNLLKYAVFVAFFPTILSGPIQRSHILLPQISEGRDFDDKKAHSGLYLLLWGYFLKIAVANPVGTMVDYAFANYSQLPGAALLWAVVLYAIQLYCDFSGYSFLAIGTAKLLGFDIGINFKQPYFAASIRDFWSRWHISLSSWLKDYIYIPLGGNRKGRLKKCRNLMITFLISGLWHGSGATFLVWGGLHGLYQIIGSLLPKHDRAGERHRPRPLHGVNLASVANSILTFILVDFAWLFFRADSLNQAFSILQQIVFHFQFKKMTYYGSYLLGGTASGLLFSLITIGMVFLVDILHENKISIEHLMMDKVNIVARWVIYIGFTLFLLLIAVRNYGLSPSTFIYAGFSK